MKKQTRQILMVVVVALAIVAIMNAFGVGLFGAVTPDPNQYFIEPKYGHIYCTTVGDYSMDYETIDPREDLFYYCGYDPYGIALSLEWI